MDVALLELEPVTIEELKTVLDIYVAAMLERDAATVAETLVVDPTSGEMLAKVLELLELIVLADMLVELPNEAVVG